MATMATVAKATSAVRASTYSLYEVNLSAPSGAGQLSTPTQIDAGSSYVFAKAG